MKRWLSFCRIPNLLRVWPKELLLQETMKNSMLVSPEIGMHYRVSRTWLRLRWLKHQGIFLIFLRSQFLILINFIRKIRAHGHWKRNFVPWWLWCWRRPSEWFDWISQTFKWTGRGSTDCRAGSLYIHRTKQTCSGSLSSFAVYIVGS